MDKKIPPWLTITITVAGIFVLGLVDWQTGYELNFFVFYFIPVSVGAWYLGFGPSVFLAVLSAVVWYEADVLSGHTHSLPVYAVWNTMVRLASFLAIGWSVAKMHDILVREHEKTVALGRTLSEIKVLESFLPICAECKKIRNQQGEWQNLEAYIGQHSNTQFSHGYCPQCAGRAREEAKMLDKGGPKP